MTESIIIEKLRQKKLITKHSMVKADDRGDSEN